MLLPGDNIPFPHQIQRTDQLHALKILAFQPGHHSLVFPAVKKRQQNGFHCIIHVMAQGNFIAPQLFRFFIQITPAHGSAHVAKPPVQRFQRFKNGAVKNVQFKAKLFGIGNHFFTVFLCISGVHGQIGYLERHVAVFGHFTHTGGQQQRILPAGNAHSHMVAGLDQMIILHRRNKLAPDLFSEIPLNTSGRHDLRRVHFLLSHLSSPRTSSDIL